MNFRDAIRRTNPPQDHKEILRQFRQQNAGMPQEFVQAMQQMVCEGSVRLYLDANRELVAQVRNSATNHAPCEREERRMIDVKTPLFKLGQVVATPGALESLEKAGQSPWEFLSRHAGGDWGTVDAGDSAANDAALKDGSRILSAYLLKDGVKIWVITEAEDDHGHRAATTILLPDEY